MKAKSIALVCVTAAAVALVVVCVRQRQELAEAEVNPFAPQGYDTRIDLADDSHDNMTWVVSGTGSRHGYALFVGEFRGYREGERRGRPFVYAMRLPVVPPPPGISREPYSASFVRLERVRKLVESREEDVEYRLNGQEVVRLDKPITSRSGMSYRLPQKLILADERKESAAYDVSGGADFNQEQDFGFKWQLHIVSAPLLKSYVDSGDLKYIWDGKAMTPASGLFRHGEQKGVGQSP